MLDLGFLIPSAIPIPATNILFSVVGVFKNFFKTTGYK
jgi:hypothetical protein